MSRTPHRQTPIRGNPRAVTGWMVALLIFGSAVFLHDLGHFPLNGDELNILNLAIGERDMNLSGGNALGYFPVVRWAASISTSEAVLRLPAVIFALIGLIFAYLLATELFRDRAMGFATAFLLAVSPIYVNHAQQVHSYAAFCTAAMASLWLIWRAYHERSSPLLLTWAVLIGFGLWLHHYMIFVAASEAVMLGCWWLADNGGKPRLPSRRARRDGVLTLVLIVVIFGPLFSQWILPLLQDTAGKSQGQEPSFRILQNSPNFDPAAKRTYERLVKELLVWRASLNKLWPALAAFSVLGWIAAFRRSRRLGYSMAIWLLLPIPPVLIFSHIAGIDFGTRRLIFLSPVIVLTWVAALAAGASLLTAAGRRLWWTGPWPKIRSVLFAVGAGSLIALSFLTTLDSYYRYNRIYDFRTAARVIEMHGNAEDVVYTWPEFLLEHYHQGKLQVMGAIRPLLPELANGKRIWFVRPKGWEKMPNVGPQEDVIREQGVPTFMLGGGLMISVLIPENDPRGLTQLQVSQTIVNLRPGCIPCQWQLAAEYEKEGHVYATRRERNRVRPLIWRDQILKFFR